MEVTPHEAIGRLVGPIKSGAKQEIRADDQVAGRIAE
jgi:hypothetical protein